MEYIRVRFDRGDIRDVLADGDIIGKTEKTLMLDAGYYEFSLSGSGYKPATQSETVTGTDPGNPLILTFSKFNGPGLPASRRRGTGV